MYKSLLINVSVSLMVSGVQLHMTLVWAIYDNQLRPGKSLSLSGFESYGQVVQCLVDKVFKGIQMLCPVCTSAMFKLVERLKLVVTKPHKSV